MATGTSAVFSAFTQRIRIHRGCDFHLFYDNIENCIADRSRFTINGQRYLMVEFADAQIPRTIAGIFQDMIRNDITPVITHPERNGLLMRRVSDLVQWVRAGCLIQVTATVVYGEIWQVGGRELQAADAAETGALRGERRA